MPGSLWESAYYRLPVFLQNAIFSAYGFKLARSRYSRHFYAELERLKRTEWWSAAEIADHQNRMVASIVRHAYETVPFYRRWYDEHGVDIRRIATIDDLQRLPILTKQLVKDHQAELVSTAFPRRSLIPLMTSGTTGTPLTIMRTPESVAQQSAIWWRHKARFGLTVKDRHLSFGARIPVAQNQTGPPYWRTDISNHRVYLSTYHISKNTVRDIVGYLNGTHFEFYTGYPSAMYMLASLMEESGLRLYNRPKQIVCGADALLPRYEAAISRVFGASVTEQYGMTEFSGNMSKCRQGAFHVDAEACHVETVKDRSESESQRLLLTGWGNLAMPFIRYQVGDCGTRLKGLCECGRHSPAFVSIDGRLEDYIVTRDGRRIGGMNQVFEYATNVREIQICQKSLDMVEFRIIPKAGYGELDRAALTREFRRRAGDDVQIRFALVDQLQRSASGKLRAVVSEVASARVDITPPRC